MAKRVSKASKRRLALLGPISLIAILYFLFTIGMYSYKLISLYTEEKALKQKLISLQAEESELKTEIQVPPLDLSEENKKSTVRLLKMNGVEVPDDLDKYLRDRHEDAIKKSKEMVDDYAQKFFYANGLNAKPTVLDDVEFSQYMKDNHLGKAQILTRNVSNGDKLSATDINNNTKYGDYTYLGGKYGGNAEGNGIYFARTGGDSTWGNSDWYDKNTSKTMLAVIDKSKFNAIYVGDYYKEWSKFEKTHPKTAKAMNDVVDKHRHAIGSQVTIASALMGYNVITNGTDTLKGYMNKKSDSSDFYNVLDRSILVIRKDDKRK